MIIKWSDEDQAFVVLLPYEEAARWGTQALESLIQAYEAEGQSLPRPASSIGMKD
jgi:hypothetical protein